MTDLDIVMPQLTPAEKNEIAIIELRKELLGNFWQLGGLLLENYEAGYWSMCGHDSFVSFVQQLGIGYSWATRFMGIRLAVRDGLFSKEEVLEIGPSKMGLLLPSAKKGTLDEDTKLLARDCTFNDLRLKLGHNVPDEESEEFITCVRCGCEFAVQKGMVRKR